MYSGSPADLHFMSHRAISIVPTAALEEAIDLFEKESGSLYRKITDYNDRVFEISEGSAKVDKLIFGISQKVSDATEYMSGGTWCFPMTGHKLYGGKLALLADALEKIKAGDASSAMGAVFPRIDLAEIPYTLSVETAEGLKKFMDETEGLSWARGKCKSRLTLSEITSGLSGKLEEGQADFSEEVEMLEQTISSETAILKEIISDETEGLRVIVEAMKECGSEIEKLE